MGFCCVLLDYCWHQLNILKMKKANLLDIVYTIFKFLNYASGELQPTKQIPFVNKIFPVKQAACPL
jgi:hypothetical protein